MATVMENVTFENVPSVLVGSQGFQMTRYTKHLFTIDLYLLLIIIM